MGTFQHDVVAVTVLYDRDSAEEIFKELQDFAVNLGDSHEFLKGDPFKALLIRVEGVVNGAVTYLVAPDGSKEGWVDSNLGDRLRAEFGTRFQKWKPMSVSWGEEGLSVHHGNAVAAVSIEPFEVEG